MSKLQEAVDRIRRAHALGHVPTSIPTHCGESDGISATYCETGTLLRALAEAKSVVNEARLISQWADAPFEEAVLRAELREIGREARELLYADKVEEAMGD